VNGRLWHHAAQLPTPQVPLLVKTVEGATLEAIRPSYISDRSAGDLGYRTLDGRMVVVAKWAYK